MLLARNEIFFSILYIENSMSFKIAYVNRNNATKNTTGR